MRAFTQRGTEDGQAARGLATLVGWDLEQQLTTNSRLSCSPCCAGTSEPLVQPVGDWPPPHFFFKCVRGTRAWLERS